MHFKIFYILITYLFFINFIVFGSTKSNLVDTAKPNRQLSIGRGKTSRRPHIHLYSPFSCVTKTYTQTYNKKIVCRQCQVLLLAVRSESSLKSIYSAICRFDFDISYVHTYSPPS